MKLEDLQVPFWFDDERAGATQEQIEEFEREVQVNLPEEFRRALMLRDGGTSTYSSFQRDELFVPIPSFFSVDILRRSEKHRSLYGVPNGVIMIAGGAHEWLGLDYRQGPNPQIVFQESEDAPIEFVAESFEALLEGLTED
ncbi:MAG: SMI1/KNR4 family protein [Myxococcota bacterium]